jgi:pyruvate dehydrogenase E2 component (dihydrolipoamide acetyltransferase)/2-oxoisovalerate dehydrogenase E2 component (dihydrolipoyl transacylase)
MDFALPEIGEGVYEAELVNWLVKPGDTVKSGRGLFEVLTDKATMEIPAPFSGTITALRAEPGSRIKVGDLILSYNPTDQSAKAGPPLNPSSASPDSPPGGVDRLPRHRNGPTSSSPAATGRLPLKAAPSVRHLARRLGIDLTSVQGSGPEGRILLEDVSTHLQRLAAARAGGNWIDSRRTAESKPDYGTPGTRIKLVGMRRAIAEHMVHATRTIPHYSYVEECEVTDLVKLRESLREPFARIGVRLTYLPFFVKAVVAALKEVPLVNASLEDALGEIVLHDRYHIGIAVATPAGLVVPVVHDADKKDLATIARDIERLSGDARLGKSKREDLKGGTFTVTSVGNLGGLFSAPVINHPEVGILGLGKIVKRPVFDAHDNVRPAHLIYLSLSFDHRVVDGAVGAAFTNVIVKQMQNPAAMLVTEPASR